VRSALPASAGGVAKCTLGSPPRLARIACTLHMPAGRQEEAGRDPEEEFPRSEARTLLIQLARRLRRHRLPPLPRSTGFIPEIAVHGLRFRADDDGPQALKRGCSQLKSS
jgi:hypothetical protein